MQGSQEFSTSICNIILAELASFKVYHDDQPSSLLSMFTTAVVQSKGGCQRLCITFGSDSEVPSDCAPFVDATLTDNDHLAIPMGLSVWEKNRNSQFWVHRVEKKILEYLLEKTGVKVYSSTHTESFAIKICYSIFV